MVKLSVGGDAKSVCLLGHGIKVTEKLEIEPGIFIEPKQLSVEPMQISDSVTNVVEYAGVLAALPLITFQIEVLRRSDVKDLAGRAWNALWLFYLISLACRAPCYPLVSITDDDEHFGLINPNVVIRPLPTIHEMTKDEFKWAQINAKSFDFLAREERFQQAMIAYGNAQYFSDYASRIMLLWSGIEGLLGIEHEQSFRIPLYLSLLFGRTAEDKYRYFTEIRDAYGVRSRVVHGVNVKEQKRQAGFETANKILIDALARCVEIRRIPTPEDYNRAALSGHLT
jgi:hypothetical protein